MRPWRSWVCCGWVCLAVLDPPVQGQVFLVLDTVRIPLFVDAGCNEDGLFRYSFNRNFEYALTGSLLSKVNGNDREGQGQFALQQSLRYSWIIERAEHITLSNSYIHRLGIQHWFDSISRIFPDENIFRTRLEYRVTKCTGFSLDSELNTRLLNSWEWVTEDSTTRRLLACSFLTPLIWTFAGGITVRIPGTGSVMAGITGGRLTLLRDTSVFCGRDACAYLGVPRGSNHLLEYGISLRFQADRTIWKILRWNCDLLLFKGTGKPADLNLKNILEVRLASFIVVSVQTRLMYEEDISRKLRVENMLSAGFIIKR